MDEVTIHSQSRSIAQRECLFTIFRMLTGDMLQSFISSMSVRSFPLACFSSYPQDPKSLSDVPIPLWVRARSL